MPSAQALTADWATGFNVPGVAFYGVSSIAETATDIYFAGSFQSVGGTTAANIARFHKADSTWSALGLGVNGQVNKILANGTDLYVTGNFTTAGGAPAKYIAKWDGAAWSTLGSGLDGGYDFLRGGYDMVMSGSILYVGGHFTSAGGVSAKYIAKWNGAAWSALGAGVDGPGGGQINALAFIGDTLYAGGEFATAGTVSAQNIAKWDGSAWSALQDGSGPSAEVNALAVIGTNLYIGGSFARAGNVQFGSENLVMWNGSTYSGVGGGTEDNVYALAVSGSTLYVGGDFVSAGSVPANNIATWNGSAWTALGDGANGPVRSLAVFAGGVVYAGGPFSAAGSVIISGVARWNGSAWSALVAGNGISGGSVNVLRDAGASFYAGGSFIGAGPVLARGIARYDKAADAWSDLAGGVTYTGPFAFSGAYVTTVFVDGTDVYIGGYFSHAGGVAANNIAKWNGSAWSPLGTGTTGDVNAIVKIGSDIYAAGYFSTAGGVSCKNIAKWDGTAWSPLGTGLNDGGLALAVMGTDLYAGGLFTTAGGVNASRIAKWNGSAWTALGGGTDGTVAALAVDGATLYAGGRFAKAGGATVNYIARWNGASWAGLGTGLDDAVSTLTVNGTNLFVGGKFNRASGEPANYIAVWNGSAWDSGGDGLAAYGGDAEVKGIVVDGTTGYIGGTITQAGGIPSSKIAKATFSPSSTKPVVSIIGLSSPKVDGITIVGTVNPKGLVTTAKIEYGTTPASLDRSAAIALAPNNGTSSKGYSVVLKSLQPGTQYFYHLTATNSSGASETPVFSFTTQSPPVFTTPPASQLVAAGANVTLTATATGTGFITYQWLKKNVKITNANGTSYALPAITAAQAGEYQVTATNSIGSTTSPTAKIGVVNTTDSTVGVKEQATLTLPAPAAGSGLTFQWFKNGSPLANKGLGGRVTIGADGKFSLTKFTAADEDSYSCLVKLGALELESGKITALLQTKPSIQAVASGSLPTWYVSGAVDAPITALITILNPEPQNYPTKFTIVNLPPGVVYNTATGRMTGKPTKAGDFKIKVTAINPAGSSATVETAPLHVEGLPAPVVGTFNGLVNRNSTLNHSYGGTLNLVTVSAGSLSGKLVLEGKPYAFTGVLAASLSGGDATAVIPVKFGASTLTLTLTLDHASGELTGNVSGPATASVRAWRNPWKTTLPANPATALAVTYTAQLRMTSPNASESYPQGDGYGMLTITTAGIATWKGQLADGTAMTCTTTVGPQGQIPLHVMLYTNTGSVQGWLQAVADTSNAPASYANNTLDNLSGEAVSWFKSPQPDKSTTRSYKGGIPQHNLTVTGGAWPKLVSPNLVLGLSDATGNNNAHLLFTKGGIETSPPGVSGTLEQALRIKAPANTVVMPTGAANPTLVKLTLTPATGLITGTFTYKDTNPLPPKQLVTRTTNYYGVLVKRLNQGVGHFLLAKMPAAAVGNTPATTPSTSPILSGKVVFEHSP